MKKLLLTVTLVLMMFASGCTKVKYVYLSMTKPPEAKGVIMVVDDRKIKVYNKETNTHTKISLKGFYPIWKTDLQAFVKALKEQKAREKKRKKQ